MAEALIHLTMKILEKMGFPRNECAQALIITGGDVEAAAALLKKKQEEKKVHLTKDHPAVQCGIAVWVDDEGKAYFPEDVPNPFYELKEVMKDEG